MADDDKKIERIREQIAKGSLVIGQIAKDPREAITATSQAIAGMIRGEGAATFARVFDNLASKGELDKDFGNSSKGRFFIQEIDEVLNGTIRDEQVLLEKIKLFMAIASNTFKEHSEDEAKEIWNIVKHLDSKDIKVLATAYALNVKDGGKQKVIFGDQSEWVRYIAGKSGLLYEEFVDESRTTLSSKRLLSGTFNANYYLSPLGLCVAEYLEEGDRLFKVGLTS